MSQWFCIVIALLLVGQLALSTEQEFDYNMNGKIEVGQSLVISGTTQPNSNKFWITLIDVSDNYALQVHVHNRVILRATRQNGIWYTEENQHLIKASKAYNPIIAGEPFKITIFVGYEGYMVAINGSPYCQFPHRMPLTNIVRLSVAGDWHTVHQVDHRTAYPVMWPSVQLDTVDEAADFSHTVPRAYRAGHRIDIEGVPQSADGGGHFVLRLDDENGGNSNCSCDGSDERSLARSSSTGEHREMWAVFPSKVVSKFVLTLVCTESGALVFRVGGKEIGSYKSPERIGFGWLRGLRIEGRDGMRVKVTRVRHSQD